MARTMKATDVRAQWSSLVNRVFRTNERIVVERSGIPVAAIVSARDLEQLDRLDEQRDDAFAAVESMRNAFADVPPDELEGEIAKAIAEVRAELRAEASA